MADFCSLNQIDVYAARHGLSQKAAIAELLSHDIWPERFRRHRGLLPPEAQIRLLDLPILIAGCGGLGGAIADMLARLGAGNIWLCDFDRFEESNLNRQRFCSESTLGLLKAQAVAEGLSEIASFGDFRAIICELTPENLPEHLANREIVIDCLDSVSGKKMLENAAKEAGIAWLHGSVLQNEGFICLSQPATATLTRLYQGQDSVSGAGSVLSHVVTGTAALMCSLFAGWLIARVRQSPLMHVDFSVPELEGLELP